jgi:UDP-glucose:(heptosyl)LPS alpha-1,3-glucosyltransferase
MKIAFVVHDYHRHGGHSRYVWELARRFVRAHEVHVFANRFEVPAEGVHFHHVPAWRRSALTSILSFFVSAGFVVREEFDIIHAQGLCGWHGQDVITAHMCLAAWYQAQERWQGRLTWKQRLFRRLVLPLERAAYQPRRSAHAIAVSRRIQDDLAHFYGRDRRVSRIYHGVDLEAFHPAQRVPRRETMRQRLRVTDDVCLALYVGDLQKGAAAALDATAAVPTVQLVLVSATPADEWRRRAQGLGILDRVRFEPSSPAIEDYYAAADLLLQPTLYDSFGMVISEAMASGLPVITTRSAGASELIEPEEDGLLIDDSADVAALASALGRLANDPDLRSRLGAAARRKMESHTWDAVAEATLEVYRRVLAEKRARRPLP